MNDLYEKIQKKMKEWQISGVPVFMIRDESKGGPSVSLTMMLISFTLCLLALINKFAKIVDGMDVDNTLQLFMLTAGLYFSRSIGLGGKKVTISKEEKE